MHNKTAVLLGRSGRLSYDLESARLRLLSLERYRFAGLYHLNFIKIKLQKIYAHIEENGPLKASKEIIGFQIKYKEQKV